MNIREVNGGLWEVYDNGGLVGNVIAEPWHDTYLGCVFGVPKVQRRTLHATAAALVRYEREREN